MGEKVIKIIFLLIAICLFVTVIVLTNDKFKMVCNTGKIIPIIIIILSFVLIGIILIFLKRNK